MRRLALLLLVLLLAVPAAAAPHCAPQPAVSSHAGGHHQDEPDAPDAADLSIIHGCIGCAAPCRSFEAAAEPSLAPPLLLSTSEKRLGDRHLIPDPPPPRRLG